MTGLFVLVHSPLVGPFTWSLIADELRRRRSEAVVPTLNDSENADAPYWRQHGDSVVGALKPIPPDRRLVLVAHSGAGPELPAIRQALPHPVAGYIFVDAGIPENEKSRLDQWAPERAEKFRQCLKAGGRFPNWSYEDLEEDIPNAQIRRRMLAELRPRAIAYWEEPIPVFPAWPDAHCAYLQFSPVYDAPAEYARENSWAFRKMDAGHFHMLVDPIAVVDALLGLTADILSPKHPHSHT